MPVPLPSRTFTRLTVLPTATAAGVLGLGAGGTALARTRTTP